MPLGLEDHIEQAVCAWADSVKLVHVKFTPQGQRGWPDRLFLPPGGVPLWIEFKRPDEEPRKLQLHRIDVLKKNGYKVEVFDDAELAIQWLQRCMAAKTTSD